MIKTKINRKIHNIILLIIIFIMITPLIKIEAATTTYTNHEINIKIDSNGCNITGYGWYWVKDSEYEWDSDTNDYHSGKRTSSSDGGPVWSQDDIRIDNVAFKFAGNVRNYTPFVWVRATAPTGYIYNGIQVTEQGSSSAEDLSVKSYNGGYITDVGCYKGDWANKDKEDREYREANSTVTFTVKKTPITYTIQYVGNGHTGGTTSNSTHTYDSSKNLTYNGFTKTGYSFKCWNTKADGTGTNYINGQSVKNLATTNGSTVQLFAQWEKNTYTMNIDYDSGVDGSSIVGAGSYAYGTKIDIFAKPKTGYHLVSILDKDSGTVWDSTNSTNGNMFLGWNIIFDRHLYINSAPNTYTVSYNANGGTGTITNSTATYNANFITRQNTFTRLGYTFNGWNESANGSGTAWNKNTTGTYENGTPWKWTYTKNITLYAQWVPNKYTLTFNPNGGTLKNPGGNLNNGTNTNSVTVTYDSGNYNIMNGDIPTKTGHTFTGWYTSTSGGNKVYGSDGKFVNDTGYWSGNAWKYTGNLTVYAQWTPNKYDYTVNHYLMNTDGSTYTLKESDTGSLNYGSSLTGELNSYTGFTAPDSQTITIRTSGNTINYYYTRNKYSVTLTEGTGISSVSGTGTYYHGVEVNISAIVSTGYHWSKWTGTYSNSSQSYKFTMPIGNVNMTANAIANTYYIKYDSNKPSGASNQVDGSMTNSEHTYNSNKQLEDNKYSIIGWHFTGWNTKADGSGKSYSNKEEVINLTSVDKATITLYAQWKANVYTITYDKNKPSNATASVVGTTVTSNNTYDISSKITVNNYSLIGWGFIGWNTKADGSGTNYIDNQEVINLVAANNGNITLYAQWKANTYIIIYKGNGATSGSMSNSTHTYDTSSKLSNNKFTKSTYNFTGWNTKPDGSGTSYSDQQSIKNLTTTNNGIITLYAQWSKPLTITFNLNGGLYGKSNQSIVLSGTVYNNQTEYTFNINGAATPAKKYTYSEQTNTIQAYGTVTSNGLNNLLTKKDIDGTLYRFLGWSTDKTATVPQETFNTYNDSHNLTYTINTSTTLYAIWEPVLIVQLKSERVLGSLTSLVDIPKSTVMASYRTNVANINGSIVTTARPGEAIRYTAQHRGNLNSLKVTFDPYITNMYDYKNPVYTDSLNQITIENAGEVIPSSGYTEANCSLNRLIQNPLSQITRLYSLPLYLGSERAKEASHQATRYYVDYTFTNSNSFYYQYTQDKPEEITIRQIIILSTNENGYTDSILEELKTKLKIRLR